MHSLLENKVFDLVDLPIGEKIVGNRWILRTKLKTDGTIDRYKVTCR